MTCPLWRTLFSLMLSFVMLFILSDIVGAQNPTAQPDLPGSPSSVSAGSPSSSSFIQAAPVDMEKPGRTFALPLTTTYPLTRFNDFPAISHRIHSAAQPDLPGSSSFSSAGLSASPPLNRASPANLERPARPFAPPLPGGINLVACLETDRVWGLVGARELVTVTVNGVQQGAATSDDLGFFWTTLYDANGLRPNFTSSDLIDIRRGAAINSFTVRAITATIDPVTNVVSGTVGGVDVPISVTIYVPWSEPNLQWSYSRTVSSDAAGHFGADFSNLFDFTSEDSAAVAYVQNGVEVHTHVYPLYTLMLRPAIRRVRGFATPGSTVTVTVYASDGFTVKDTQSVVASIRDLERGWFVTDWNIDLIEHDIVAAQFADGVIVSRTVDRLTSVVDAVNDRVTGQAQPGATLVGFGDDLTFNGYRTKILTTTASASGAYTLNFAGLANLTPGHWVGVYAPDARGNDISIYNQSPSVDVAQTHDVVAGSGGSVGVSEGQPVTVTLYSAAAASISTYTDKLDRWGMYKIGTSDIQPGDVVTVTSGSWSGTVHVMTITTGFDLAHDRITGSIAPPADRVEAYASRWGWSWLWPIAGDASTLATTAPAFTATFNGFDLHENMPYEVAHFTADGYVDRVYHETGGVGVFALYNAVVALASPPGTPFTVTLRDASGNFKAQRNGTSQPPIGVTGWIDFWSSGQQIEIGDRVQVQSAAGFSQTVIVPTLTLTLNRATNILSGTAPANTLLMMGVDNQGYGYAPSHANGQFVVALEQLQEFTGDGSPDWGDSAYVIFFDQNYNFVYNGFTWPYIAVNYTMNGGSTLWGSNAFPGKTILITVTDPLFGEIATATTTGGACQKCSPTDFWVELPTGSIAPGEWVTVDFGDGYVDTIEVAALTGHADVEADLVTGTAPANGSVRLTVYDLMGNKKEPEPVQVDANGVYTFDLGAWGWDVKYGDTFDLNYLAPHGHDVVYTFWLAAPDLRIDKWYDNGAARPGGVFVYRIDINNGGNGEALHTIVTDTLPLSTTWAGDTSGITPGIGANGVITWNFGAWPVNQPYRTFRVTLILDENMPEGAGRLGPNCASIGSDSPGEWDPGNNVSCSAEADVHSDEVETRIAKVWPDPADPVPGEEFDFGVEVCNDRSTAVGPVWLTSTLPAATTLIGWQPEREWENYWNEISRSDEQLVLVAPGLPPTCARITLRLRVNDAVPLGTALSGGAKIGVANDVELSNQQAWFTAYASAPRTDLEIDKSDNKNVLAPGGWIIYHVSYANRSNTSMPVLITETLPPGITYHPNSATRQNTNEPAPPSLVTNQFIIWDLGTLAVNESSGIYFRVDVSSTLIPNTVLTNCAAIAPHPLGLSPENKTPFSGEGKQAALPSPEAHPERSAAESKDDSREGGLGDEDTPWNNTACLSTTIYAHGPNLRVRQYVDWWGQYKADPTIPYQASFENVGDQPIDEVWITDTLPASTTYKGWWNMDFDWSRLISNTQDGNVLRWNFSTLYPGDFGWLYFESNLDDYADRPRWYTNTIEISRPSGDLTPEDNRATHVSANGEINYVEMRVSTDRLDLWGKGQPNAVMTFTTASYQTTATTNEWGDWNIYDNNSTIGPGEVVTLTIGRGWQPLVIHVPAPFDVQADSITDRVWGQIDALDHQLIDIDVYNYLSKVAQTDSSGYFTRTFGDIRHGASGEVRYATVVEGVDITFHRDFATPDLILDNVDYGHDWVEGNYAPGHTVWITVTDGGGTFKGGAVISTTAIPWRGGQTGFSTNYSGWTNGQPDMQPGDWVYAITENGYAASVHIGAIMGAIDADANTISGTITASWFTQPLNGSCGVWAPDGPRLNFTVDPNGGAYVCNFSPYDLRPGQDVDVVYQEPDGDSVINMFREPAPDPTAQTWIEGNGETAPGAPVVFGIQYQNNGDAAGTAVLTGTLPPNTAYITDSSGLPVFVNGSVITWNLGMLEPYTLPHRFQLVLSHSANISDTLRNIVDIGGPYDSNLDNNHGEAEIHVGAGQPDLSINKWANPGDPAPGQLFRYDIAYNNNGPVASGLACLSDTLPVSTSLVTWYSSNDYNSWTEVSHVDRQLQLCVPAIPGQYGDQIRLVLQVDASAPIGAQLVDTVEITTANDADPNNNLSINDWTWVKEPRFNLSLDKAWNAGALVPGYEINYNLNLGNNGNSIVHNVIVTDTLPDGVTFIDAQRHLGWGIWLPLTPTRVVDNQIAWNLGNWAVNEERYLMVRVRIDPQTPPGAILSNCATISSDEFEHDPYDNSECLAETVRPAGANLRVIKTAQWQDANRVRYRLEIDNIGTTQVDNVVVTDTFPISGSLNWWNLNYWDQWNGQVSGNQLTLTLSRLNPHSTAWLELEVHLPSVPQRAYFTNTAQVTIPPDDVYPADNTAQVVIGTGPDLLVGKYLSGGVPRPGELLTYTLHYQNDSHWNTSGNVWITDTLPTGVTFITSTQRHCGDTFFCPLDPNYHVGATLAWSPGQLCSRCGNDIVLTVRVTGTISATARLTNTAQVASDDPLNDLEPFTTNNTSVLVLPIARPQFTLTKTYQGNRVAGTPVLYTLRVTNTGNYTDTRLRVIDQLPDWLTYGGGGSYSSGLVTWTVPSLGPNRSASLWFSGTLSCSAGGLVNNRYYRVAGSDLGITTTDGVSVSFVISAPTITASFVRTPDPIVAGKSVAFTGTASTNGSPLNITWNFGDGMLSTNLKTTHVYTRSGNFAVVFTVRDACNYFAQQVDVVSVEAPTINASFTQSATSVLVNSTVRFTDTSTTNGSPLAAWRWNFGDGVSTQRHPTHTYSTAGAYTVTLIVTDSYGYTATRPVPSAIAVLTPRFEISKNYQGNRVAGTVITYTLRVTNTGNYTATRVKLIDDLPNFMTYGGGGNYKTGSITWTIPSIRPAFTTTAWFSGALSCVSGVPVDNKSYRVYGSDQGITSTSGLTVSFVITPPTINLAFNRTPDPIAAGRIVTFAGSANTNGKPLTHAWDFGDGTTGSGLNTTHAYTQPGVYVVIFSATDACSYSGSKPGAINLQAPTLIANFMQSMASITVNSSVRFTDTSTTNGSALASWQWSFGDGATSAQRHSTHAYTALGSYTVTLLITDTLGYTATRVVSNAVIVIPGGTWYHVHLPLILKNR